MMAAEGRENGKYLSAARATTLASSTARTINIFMPKGANGHEKCANGRTPARKEYGRSAVESN
jgi:hypothetical protein